MDIRIKKGHDLKLTGGPACVYINSAKPTLVALKPTDFRYLRPRLKVKQGSRVKTGAPLFESKDDPRIVFVSPGSGKIEEIRYGPRRKLLEVVISLDDREEFEEAGKLSPEDVRKLSREQIIEKLLKGGLWPMILERPFSRIADPGGKPKAVFVSAMASEPFLPNPDDVLEEKHEDFQLGLDVLKKLTDGQLHLCVAEGASSKALVEAKGVTHHRFSGPHPAGNIGVQIYHIDAPRGHEKVWYLSAQDVLAVAHYLSSGRFPTTRVVTVAGPGAKRRGYFVSRIGILATSLVEGYTEQGEMRTISGGVLTGTNITSAGFLGFYDASFYILPEGRKRELLGFVWPGFDKYSLSRAFLSGLTPDHRFPLDTNRHGGLRNFVMNGIYEDVCPVDILPQQLAKAVLAGDIEESERHGILDCAACGLCTFVCPSKIEIGSIIQDGLDAIIKESQ